MSATGTAEALPPEQLPLFAGLFVGLFALSFVFSGTETAFFSLQDLDRRRMRERDDPADRRVLSLLADRTSLISTILMGNETVNVAIATTAAALAVTLFPGRSWISVAVVTPALVLLSEITPKVLAYRYHSPWARAMSGPIALLMRLLWLPRVLVVGVVDRFAALFGVHERLGGEGLGEQDFMVLVERGAAQGTVDEAERDIIEAVFELDDMPVSRLMTPRPDVFSVSLTDTYEDLMAGCREHRYSRIPVYDEDLDDLVGVLLLRDLLKARAGRISTVADLQPHFLQPVFVPETKPSDEMMREMIKSRTHIAFVVDEYGSLVGLLSLDDLIAELVGDLGEETREETNALEQEGTEMLLKASLDIEDVMEQTGIEIPEGDYHTLGGFVFAHLGHIPVEGERFEAVGMKFEVRQMEGRRIAWLAVSSPLEHSAQLEEPS